MHLLSRRAFLNITHILSSSIAAKCGGPAAAASASTSTTESIPKRARNGGGWRKNSNNDDDSGDNTRDGTVVTKDFVQVFVRSGSGGNGLPRYNGVGGCGGFVYARPTTKLSFDQFCQRLSAEKCDEDEQQPQQEGPQIVAENGENSLQTRLVGRHGRDKIIDVPVGVEIVGENSVLLARCSKVKTPYLLAKGGIGGCADNKFKAEPGEAFMATVNLKLTPNVGLIGFPNAGKSTLMKALVPGKNIRIASYAFTTTRPQLCYIKYVNGIVCKNRLFLNIFCSDQKRKAASEQRHYHRGDGNSEDDGFVGVGDEPSTAQQKTAISTEDDELSEALSVVKSIRMEEATGDGSTETEENIDIAIPFSLSIADLPGIVEGASQNRYNAYDCLKHLEYSDIIVMVVDVHGFQLGPNEPYRSALEIIALLNKEMEQYDRTLIRKPVVLLLNKVDMEDGEQKANELCDFLLGQGSDGLWPQRLAEERASDTGQEAEERLNLMMPRYPIRFRSVHAISAKQGRLGNVKAMLRRIHRELNPLKSAQFDDDWEQWSTTGRRPMTKRKKVLC